MKYTLFSRRLKTPKILLAFARRTWLPALVLFFMNIPVFAQYSMTFFCEPPDITQYGNPQLWIGVAHDVDNKPPQWYNNGARIDGLPENHSFGIDFTEIHGYYKPYETTMTLTANSNSPPVYFNYHSWSNSFSVRPVYGDGEFAGSPISEATWTLVQHPSIFTNPVSGSGGTEGGKTCPTGTYSIKWGNIAGWKTPGQTSTNIAGLGSEYEVAFTGVYTRVTGRIEIDVFPAEVTNAGWQFVEYPADYDFYTSDPLYGTNAFTITNAPAGEYVLRWEQIDGWHTPPEQTNNHQLGPTLFRASYGQGAKLEIHIYQPGEDVEGAPVRLDGIGSGYVTVEPEGLWDGANGWYYTPGTRVTMTAVPTVTGAGYDSFFFEWWGTNAITANPLTRTIGTPGMSNEVVSLNLLFSREYHTFDNVGDLDQDGLPDEWERKWGLDPKDQRGNHGKTGNPDEDFVPNATTNPPVILHYVNNISTYYSYDYMSPAYPLRSTNGYNRVSIPFNNFLECRGFDGFYGTNGPSGAVPDDDPKTDPGSPGRDDKDPQGDDSDDDGLPDGWEYYFWRWRSADAAARGLTGAASNDWVTLHPNRWNDNSYDTDNDGLSDIEEYFGLLPGEDVPKDTFEPVRPGTDPTHSDSDGDGMDDKWEKDFGVACNPLYQPDWQTNYSMDYYAVVAGAGTISSGQVGTAFAYDVYKTGDAYWADVTGDSAFTILKDMLLAGDIYITSGATGTLVDAVYYGTNASMPAYRHGDAIWSGADVYNPDTCDIIFNPPLKHVGVYTMPPAEQRPGFTSFDPRVGWNPPDRSLVAKEHPNTAAYINYEQYRGANQYGRLSWDGSGYNYTIDPDDTWTDPTTIDTDGDGMPDGWELYVGLQARMVDHSGDPDGDKLFNIDEWANTNHPLSTANAWPFKRWPTDPGAVVAPSPNDPHPKDTDWDGLTDDAERSAGSDPTNWDTDGDKLPDGWEIYAGTDVLVGDSHDDKDGDGLLNWQEYWTGTVAEWMACDASWGLYFLSRTPMPWNPIKGSAGGGEDEDEDTFPHSFMPPDFLSCPSFMYNNGVFQGSGLSDAEILEMLRQDYPAAAAKAAPEYHTTLANDPDSDGDLMDDYWEVFHGLNPCNGRFFLMEIVKFRRKVMPPGLLVSYYDADPGAAGFQTGVYDWWSGGFIPFGSMRDFIDTVGTNTIYQTMIAGPLHFGLAGMDPDGDGLPNIDEYSYMDDRAVYHTCPTSYTRTDRNDTGSFVSMNYGFDAYTYDMIHFPFGLLSWPFRFGSVEGFDTDNDGRGDYPEVAGAGGQASDPVDSRTPPRNRALLLDGVADYLRTIDGFHFSHGSGTFTRFCVEAWVMQVDENVGHDQVIIDRAGWYDDPYNPGRELVRTNFKLGINAEGLPYIAYHGMGPVTMYMATADIGYKMAPNVWTHVAGNYDGEILTIYVNGRVSASVRTTELPVNINNHTICIGARDLNPGYSIYDFPSQPTDHYKGYIDEVRVWRAPRSVSDITDAMYRKLSQKEINESSSLQTYYTFDDVPDPDKEVVVPDGMADLDTQLRFHPTIQWWAGFADRSTVYTGHPWRPYNYIVFAEDHVFHKPVTPAWDDYVHTSELGTEVTTNIFGVVITNIVRVGEAELPDTYINTMNPYFDYNSMYQEINQDVLFLRGSRAVGLTNTWIGGAGDGADMLDSDGDGLPDAWEVVHGLDPFDGSDDTGAWGDPDGDGLSNIAEYLAGTSPMNFDSNQDGHGDYYASDGPGHLTYGELYSDGDGMSDAWEVMYGLDPSRDDASEDPDNDGWSNYAEYMGGTHPTDSTDHPNPTISGLLVYDEAYRNDHLVVSAYTTNSMDGIPQSKLNIVPGSVITVDSEPVGHSDGSRIFSGRLPNRRIPQGTEITIAPNIALVDGWWEPMFIFTENVEQGGTNYYYTPEGRNHSAEIDYNEGTFTVTWDDHPWSSGSYFIMVSYSYQQQDFFEYNINGLREGDIYISAFKDLNQNGILDLDEPFGITDGMKSVDMNFRNLTGPNISLKTSSDIPWFPRFKWSDSSSSNTLKVIVRNLETCANMINTQIRKPRDYFHEGDYMRLGYPEGLPAGNYQWTAGGDSGYFSVSSPDTLDAPVLISPRGEVLNYSRNELVWTMDRHATRYRLQIITPTQAYLDSWFSAPSPGRDDKWRDYLPYIGAWDNQTFFWRMMIGNNTYESPWAEWQTFSVKLASDIVSKEITGHIYYYGKIAATNLVVEAFNNDAFAGYPEARVHLDIPLTNTPFKAKYSLKGLRPGIYYVRAFLDVDPAGGERNGRCESWSSRGFYVAASSFDRRPSSVDVFNAYKVDNVHVFISDHDTDNDNMPDAWEMWYFGTMAYTGDMDFDGDGISNLDEYAIALLNTDPTLWDTAGDGLSDWFKMNYGSPERKYNPYNPVNNPSGVDLNATAVDTDGDGFSDAMELYVYGTDPLDPDSFPRNPAAYATGYGATADFDGDGRSDLGVFYQIEGQWYILTWRGHFYALPFGWQQTTPLLGDFDGDGKTDIAVYYPPAGTWYIWTWSGQYYAVNFGGANLVPVPGDYSGDGRTDFGVFDNDTGIWHILTWSGEYYPLQFGWPGVQPVAGDFDFDGKSDFAVFHPESGQWHILTWTGLYYSLQFGWNETIPVAGDYDGDGRTDLAVYHQPTGNWYILTWQGHYYQINFGWNETVPVAGDYDGDRRHDLAVYHPATGNWYVWTWRGSFYQIQFGWPAAAPPQKGR